MNKIIASVEQFLKMEYDLRRENYLQENKDEWEKSTIPFREKFLSPDANKYWFKIPIEHFSVQRRNELMESTFQRKLYLVKFERKNELINVFCSLPDSSNDLRNCLLFKNSFYETIYPE